MPPAVSVVMPVYNAADTLAEAIQSISDQTFTDFEFVIVDDGSEDESASLIRRATQLDSRIKLISIPHSGIVTALNTGLNHASGTYIARMDADDGSLPERLELQHRFLETHPDTGLVACRVQHWGKASSQAGYARYIEWSNALLSHDEIQQNRFVESPLAHPSVMFRRCLVEELGGYRAGAFPEDYELWLRWLQAGVHFCKIPEKLLRWRDTASRLSRIGSRYSFDAFYTLKARYLASWLKKHNSFYPEVVIWGAGQVSQKRAELLTSYGVRICGYIDVDPAKIGKPVKGRPVIDYRKIPTPGSSFIISYVGNHGARADICAWLNKRGYCPVVDYILAA